MPEGYRSRVDEPTHAAAHTRPRIALMGTHDTKGEEIAWVSARLESAGCTVVTIDAGTWSSEERSDIGPATLASRAGTSIEEVRRRGDRGEAVAVLAEGVRAVIAEWADTGQIHGVLAVGGSGGSAIAAPALQSLPLGFPKLLVSTMVSGDVRPYVGASDVTLTYSVVDIAGMNPVSEMILDNAVAAVAAMARAFIQRSTATPSARSRPIVVMSMFGVTTPAVDEARARLEGLGYEVLVFHATGSGGMAMEKLITSGLAVGVCDVTTTELADELAGGMLSAGPHRLTAAARCALPQVISVGAMDMVNFGPPETVPDRYTDRLLLRHNPAVTLMRTTPEEMSELGRRLADRVSSTRGPASVFLPLAGVSSVDVLGQPFYDSEADHALFEAVRTGLADTDVELVELPMAINDVGFGASMADRLHAMISAGGDA